MRVPIPIVVILCLVAISGTWWWWTHDRDFLRPPSNEALMRIRAEIASPGAGNTAKPQHNIPAPVSPPRPAPAPPRLAEFAEIARESPGKLPTLAAGQESRGDFQRALLAHERIVDSTKVTGDALASSLQAMRRLRAKLPLWNARPDGARVLILHAGTAENNAARIEPVIARLAAEISHASHGILSVHPLIHRGPTRVNGDPPPPVAVWIGGAAPNSPTTPVRAITLKGEDVQSAEIARACFELIAGDLANKSRLRVPLSDATDDAAIPFADRVTRLAWETIGSSLNAPAP